MKLSLIVPTVDRLLEVERLLKSLQAQTYTDFEIIIVDQNDDDRLASVIERHGSGLTISRIRCQRGASRARNAGARHAGGQLIAFPDDDCWYPPDLLASVHRLMVEHPDWDGIAIRGRDDRGALSVNRIDDLPGRVTRLNALRRGTACCLFLHRRVIDRIGGMDESLGAGTRWVGTEDTDWLHRIAAARFHVRFIPDLYVCHPQIIDGFGPAARDKEFRYSMGMGRLLRKNEFPLVFVLLMLTAEAKELSIALISGRRGETPFHAGSFIGICRGWLGV
ncbi:MAG TPA: glycosyltransferase [Tepidisphaeraceae bacterium]|nr:glycosyltransferase [Tepidisphaeraceae bacterium]